MSRSGRWMLVGLGSLCVALGAVGVFVPVLPTTPFLLLAAFFYARSSARCHRWLLGNRAFGPYLRRYLEDRAMLRRDKVLTLVFLWGALGTTAGFAVSALWVRLLLAAVAVGVSLHVLSIRSQGGAAAGGGPGPRDDGASSGS